jgi:hypothetical protein
VAKIANLRHLCISWQNLPRPRSQSIQQVFKLVSTSDVLKNWAVFFEL